ncbi:PAS domain-containing protein [Piscinibacter sakaiensis]|uniref:PAS domain-containing protein n=1 Tax=Piscinibacter sakaiensis TaxID=1547922 RepID=UPI003AAD2E5B
MTSVVRRLPPFLAAAGAVAGLLRALDWSRTPLGPPESWPAAVCTLVEMMLVSNQPMFLAWGPQRTLIYNDAYSIILGSKHPAAMGRDFLAVWDEIRADLVPIVDQAYRGEPVQMDDIELIVRRHGVPEETHFSFFYSPVRDDSGTVNGLFCACTEITAQVLAERRLRDSESRLRGVLSNMDEGFALFDRDFRIVDVNSEAARQDGRGLDEMLGRCLWDLHPGLESSPVGAMYRRVLRDQEAGVLEFPYRWPNGKDAWLEVRAYPTGDGLAVFFRDVSERRRIAELAAASAERLQLALDAGAIVGTWVWDVPGNRFVADARFARSFGLDSALCQSGLPLEWVMESIHPDDRPRVGAAIGEALAQGGQYRCEYRVRPQEGGYRWIEANGHVELSAQGEPLRFPGVLLDIEERRRVEAERDHATALLRTFIEAVPGVVYAKDAEGRMLVANRGTAELIGKPPEEFLGKTDAEFLSDPAEGAAVMANDRRIMASGQTEQIEEEVRRPGGAPAYWLSTKAPLRDAEGRVVGLIGSSVDITERKREQERARVEAEMLDLLNRTGARLAAELDLDKLIQSVTDAATQLTGARFGAFFSRRDDDHGGAFVLHALCGVPREAFERWMDARPTPVREHRFDGAAPVRIADLVQHSSAGSGLLRDGLATDELQLRSYLAVSVVSRTGEVIGGLVFGHREPGVFTERAERLATGIAAQAAVAIDNAQLYAQAQRSAAERKQLLESERAARTEAERASTLKDEFLATLSHELRTPLSAILGWVHILRRKYDGGDTTLLKGVEVIERSTRVQTQLIEDLLDMSRILSGKLRLDKQPVAPLSFVQAAVDAVQPMATAAGVRIETEFEDVAFTVEGDSGRLQQVMWNLLANAVKFSTEGGVVKVGMTTREGSAQISVSDRGVGIAADFLPHVFDRFRQADGSITRRFGGLGLGLSIVRRLVEMHGGSVQAASAGPGQGATFTVMLPLQAERLVPARSPQRRPHVDVDSADVDLAGLKVLVVDDEPDVLDLLGRVLQDARAEVVAAPDAATALAAFETHRPQLLISDIGMPQTDGYQLLREIRRLRSPGEQVCAIALTAFARPEDRRRALESGFDLYLSKPIEPADLVMRVADLAARCARTANVRV